MRRQLRYIVYYFIIIILVAQFFRIFLGNSKISVGIELSRSTTNSPLLIWGERQDQKQIMSLIDADFTPLGGRSFILINTGKRNSKSKGNDVSLINFPQIQALQGRPDDIWVSSFLRMYDPLPTSATIIRSQASSKLYYFGNDQFSSITLLKSPSGGVAKVISATRSDEIDLYSSSPSRAFYNIKKSSKPSVIRYQAWIPRSALKNLKLQRFDLKDSEVESIFVGTFVPMIYCKGESAYSLSYHITPHFNSDGSVQLNLPFFIAAEAGGSLTLIILSLTLLLSSFSAILIAGCVIRYTHMIWTKSWPAYELAPFSWRIFCGFFFPALITWCFYLFCFYPGGMTSDSTDQWNQIHTMVINDAHPAFHTLTYKLFTLICDNPAFIAFVQIVLMAGTVSLLYSTLLRLNVNKYYIALAYLTVLASPRNGNLTITLWKDILYTIVVTLYTLMLTLYVLNPKKKRSISYWATFGLLLAIIPLYRHNGLLIMAVFIIVLPLFYRSDLKFIALSIIVTLGFFFCVKKVVYRAFHVTPNQMYESLYQIMRLTDVVHRDLPLSNQDLKVINNIYPLEKGWPYYPVSASLIIFDKDFNRDYVASNASEIIALHNKLLTGYPLYFIRFYLRINAFIWIPWEPFNDRLSFQSYGVYPNKYGIQMRPLLPKCGNHLQNIMQKTMEKKWNWIFWRAGLHHYVVLLALIILIYRTRNLKFLLIFMPTFLNTASYLIAGLSQDIRYLFPMTLMMTFYVGLAIMKVRCYES